MQQAHNARISFKQLRNACVENGLIVSLHIFEGGETVVVRKQANSEQIVRITRQDGDDETASAAAAHWLIERKYLTLDNFKEG